MRKILLLATIFLVCSCATKRDIIYFQNIDELNETGISQSFEPIIEANDILYITISSLNPDVILPFIKTPNPSNTGNNNFNPGLQGYLVNVEGNIILNVIGEIQVAKKTRGQAIQIIKNALKSYVTDVVVDVRIMNFEVTVLGAVNMPGKFAIKDERISIPEALALAGDLTEFGQRNEIIIVREVEGLRKTARIDLRTADFFESEFYFLKQNDLVYVLPSEVGVKQSGFIPDVPGLLSLVTVILSTVILLTR